MCKHKIHQAFILAFATSHCNSECGSKKIYKYTVMVYRIFEVKF